MGLDVPQVTKIAGELRRRGLPIDPAVYTIEDLKAELLALKGGMRHAEGYHPRPVFPGDTFIHRLDPRTKILAVVLYIVALFNAKWLVSYGVVAAVLLACILVSKVHFSALTRGLKPVFVIVIFTAVMNLFFTGGTPVCDVWLLRHITWEGIWSAGFMVVRIVMLIMGTFLLTYTTSPISLTDGLESRSAF